MRYRSFVKKYQIEWFQDVALYTAMFVFLALFAGAIEIFLRTIIEEDTRLYNIFSNIKLCVLILDIGVFFLMVSLTTVKVGYDAWLDISTAIKLRKRDPKSSYSLYNVKFSTFVDLLEDRLSKFCPESTDKAAIELLHWVPAFTLSRGIKSSGSMLEPSDSSLYIKIKNHLQEYGGRIICYDGLSMYRFLYKSRLLYRIPSNYVVYLREAYSIMSSEKVDVRLFSDEAFPYTLLCIGNDVAVIDFTSRSDLLEAQGYTQASHLNTPFIFTDNEKEIKRLKNNIFNMYFKICKNSSSSDEIERTLLFLENVANDIEESGKLERPEVYQEKYWNSN